MIYAVIWNIFRIFTPSNRMTMFKKKGSNPQLLNFRIS